MRFSAVRSLCVAALLSLAGAAFADRTALDRYVAAADPSFAYRLVQTTPAAGCTVFVLDMTSQTWRKPSEVDRTKWQHWVTIVKPDKVRGDTGLLFLTGGSNNGRVPAAVDPGLLATATGTQSVVVEVRMIPNQPLTFAGETEGRVEDSLIAYTWDKFLRGGDDEWPARLPMTKAAVRAMDAATEFLAGSEGGRVALKRFVVAGASKRGWTTWTTAAVDPRVVAIVPLVIDLLNLMPSFEHHHRVYGFFAPAVKDYEDMGIMDQMRQPRFAALMKIVEPYSYRDRLTLPKFLINAAGDEFFLPDSSQFYFDELRGEKHLRYVPNASHSLAKTDARESMVAFYDAILHGRARPRYSWRFTGKHGIEVKTETPPVEVRLWQASNPKARDFRLASIGPAWTSARIAARKGNTYAAEVDAPKEGFSAYFVEMTYPSGGKYPYKFTTGVRVNPDTLPHASYQAKRERR